MDTAENWARKAIRATKGNQSLLGCVVIAMLGRAASNPPRFISPTAKIDAVGRIFCPLEDRHGRRWIEYPERVPDVPGSLLMRTPRADEWSAGGITFSPGTVTEVRDELRRLADHLKLIDADRTAMFEEFRKWIESDARASSVEGGK